MDGRTLVVMEGGHPWGFRIEGGAEVREPIRINKVLEGGKAESNGIEVGDILSSINGEDGRNMTISRARHLVRCSDNLLILEVSRPSKAIHQIPEMRVRDPNENQINGQKLQRGSKEELKLQRNIANKSMAQVLPRSSTPVQTSSRVPGVRPVPPPKPPLAIRNAHRPEDLQKMVFTLPASPQSPVNTPQWGSPGVISPPASAVNGSPGSPPSYPASWQNSKGRDTAILMSPGRSEKPFRVHNPVPVSPKPGFVSPKRNTEPAPIKPGTFVGHQATESFGTRDNQQLHLKKAEPVDGKLFRQRTTDAGTTGKSLSSTAVVLPLSSTSGPTVSQNEPRLCDLHITEDPYDLLPTQNEKALNFQRQNNVVVQYQNSYNTKRTGFPAAVPNFSSPHEKSWPRKIEDFQTGYESSSSSHADSQVDSNMYPDYEYLSPKPVRHQTLGPSPRQHTGQPQFNQTLWRDQNLARDHFVADGQRYRGITSRQKLDEDYLRRKLEIERVIAEEKRRRYLKDQMASTLRKHSDNYTPLLRPSILSERYSDDEVAEALARPIRQVHTKIRGKARALYTFRAQNSRELSFKRNDIIYILRQIDKNWYEGERHGMVGIFPVTYVEVITSLDEARATAILREGNATAIYNFKAVTDRELPMRKGDLVTLIRRVDENWYEGRIGRRQGIFPVTYVETHREPDTPMVTPMSSLAPTPIPGTPVCHSPASSLFSVGPEIPSAPMSPLDSEFYESDWDAEMTGALQAGRPLNTSRPTSPSYMSDREITPVRAVTSPVPRFSTEPQFYGVRSVTSPVPQNGSHLYGPRPSDFTFLKNSTESQLSGIRAVVSPIPKGVADPNIRNVRNVTSPVPKTPPDFHFSIERTITSPVPRAVTVDGPLSPQVRSITSPVPRAVDGSYSPQVRSITSPLPRAVDGSYSSQVRSITSPVPRAVDGPHSSQVRSITSPTPRAVDGPQSPQIRAITSPVPKGAIPPNFINIKEITPPNSPRSPVAAAPRIPESGTLNPPLSPDSDQLSADSPKALNSPPLSKFHTSSPANMNLQKGTSPNMQAKEMKKLPDGVEQHPSKTPANTSESPSPGKPSPTSQRPPSGRPASAPKSPGKQRPGIKLPSTEQRDVVAKPRRCPNPYVRYRAVYNYKQQNIDELELNRGDIVYVMEKCADGWFVGISDRTKQFGTFPGNYVRPI